MNNYLVTKEQLLLPFLRENIKNKSKNNLKRLISNNQIKVDNKIIKDPKYPLKKGQTITIVKQINLNNKKLKIIYEDNNIIVIDKPSNLLTISTKSEKENTLYHQVSDYLKIKKQKVFIIHRLDKDTSGVIMFAKNPKIQKLYQENWNKLAKTREYTAVVEGQTKEKDIIKSYLKQTKNLNVYSSTNGLLAITEYQKIKSNKKYTMLKIHIKTGRRNQIRVHMYDNKTPIIGDKKYNSKHNPIKRLGLHANKLEIIDPITKKINIFISKVPEEFNNLF